MRAVRNSWKGEAPSAGGQGETTRPSGVEPVSGARRSSRPVSGATHPVVEHASALYAAPAEPDRAYPMPITVSRARSGDREALELLVREQLPRVAGLLRRLLGPRADMDDLVQNVFLELCRALPGFRGDSAISTFIGGITVRVARRAMRPTAYARLRGPMPAEPEARAQLPEARAVASEQLRRLDEALSRLTPEKRIAFVLWAIEGTEVAEIAVVMGASVSATRSRIFYAQKELKAMAAADPYLSELLETPDA